jgi:NADH-quinone oxidoreductase subunit F
MKINEHKELAALKEKGLKMLFPGKIRITVGMGTCGIGNGSEDVFNALKKEISSRKIKADVVLVGCFGYCSYEPLVSVHIPNQPLIMFSKVTVSDIPSMLECINTKQFLHSKLLLKIQEWDFIAEKYEFGKGAENIPNWNAVPFYKGQKKIVLRNCGLINPSSIEEFIAVGGYSATLKALTELKPEDIINEVKKSNLRGRGGAGFPTGRKWELMKNSQGPKKYIICNADEGDPGAYMNRNEIEGDPHSLIEGMIIGAYAMGADEGIIYCRAEYPLAITRLRDAISDAEKCGLLGSNILGSQFSFKLHIVEGAGAFVCGEETALIASIEGKAGRPRPRPPFPAQKGLWEKPTNINNVETWFNISPIIIKGASWFLETGTAKSAGTKVFSLVGKIKNTGLVEIPFGVPLETMLYNIGGGSYSKKGIKAVQLGGPSGGCVPSQHFTTPIDYESLSSLGAILGSGGIVAMDEFNCMVDVARYFLEFTTSESCGKCVPCRVGLNQLLSILVKITKGKGTIEDLSRMESLCQTIKKGSLCGLGQTAPNPILTTLKYFKNEYLSHINEKRCIAGSCEQLFEAPCENRCPMHPDLPGFLRLIRENRMEDAYQLFIEQNPFPSITGRVCQEHCESTCRRHDLDGSVHLKEMHRYVGDLAVQKNFVESVFKKLEGKNFPSSGKTVGIIGSGPSGLIAAFYLSRLGHKVTVYERMAQPGGMLRYGIPEYRLPKSTLDKEIENITKFGVNIKTNFEIGKDLSLQALFSQHDAILISTGVWKESELSLPGMNLEGIFSSIKFLNSVVKKEPLPLGQRVVVIGGGNSAIDSARTALRLGKQVTIVYRREKEEMPAMAEEIFDTEEEKIPIRFMQAPKEVIGEHGKVKGLVVEYMTHGDIDKSGRRKPIPTGKMETIPCDSIIMAIGETIDSKLFEEFGLRIDKAGRLVVEEFSMQTNDAKIFASGDIVSGPSDVTTAMAAGKRAAFSIDYHLMGQNRAAKLFSRFEYPKDIPEAPMRGKKNIAPKLKLEERVSSFKEVNQGFCEEQVMDEACRCLRCDVKENEEEVF